MQSRAELSLHRMPEYLHQIVDRLASFEASVDRKPEGFAFTYPFGTAFLGIGPDRLAMVVTADTADGLQRVRELVTVAVQIYARQENPKIAWLGDLAGDSKLTTFRKLSVTDVAEVTPRMRRIRLAGEDLGRYGAFGGLHVRMLFPTPANTDPVWPVAGPNGQPFWPDEARRPVARVYTIRHLDALAGHMDIDFVVHGDEDGCEGVGSAWAMKARIGDEVGIIGPLGRAVRTADWYVLGCDETGLPAAGRILENLPADTNGVAFIEIADKSEQQTLRHPDGVSVNWIYRNGVPAGEHGELYDAIAGVEWPTDVRSFGWFAAEADAARKLREYWRSTLSYGRNSTLVAGYWRRGESGVMAG